MARAQILARAGPQAVKPPAAPGDEAGPAPSRRRSEGAERADADGGRLDAANPLPLWAQLVQDLRRRLAANEFAERFPTELELAQSYGISRHTVREALRRLEEDGLVVRRQGRGTSVARRQFEQPLRGLYHLADILREQAGQERSQVLRAEVGPAGRVAEMLGATARQPVVLIERLRFAGDEPVALDRSWLPASVGERLLKADLSAGSLYDLLAQLAGVRVTGGWERILAVNPPVADRRLLRLPRGEAALAVERLALAGEQGVEWRESSIRGDRFCLLADWSEIGQRT